MGYLIALGLFVAFCAALLNPYGRKLLLTMVGVVALVATLLALFGGRNLQGRPEPKATSAALAAADPWAEYVDANSTSEALAKR